MEIRKKHFHRIVIRVTHIRHEQRVCLAVVLVVELRATQAGQVRLTMVDEHVQARDRSFIRDAVQVQDAPSVVNERHDQAPTSSVPPTVFTVG